MPNRKIFSFRACLLQLGGVLICLAVGAFSAFGADSGAGEAVHVESEVMWYTTMALDDSTILVGRFQERFPAVNVKLFRANDAQLLNRLLTENRAKTNIADVVSASGLPIGILKDRGLLAKYRSPEAAAFPDGAKDPDGFWTDTYINTFNLVYNTTMVPAKDVPKSYEALLDPRWKQRMALDDSDYEWFGNMLQIMGEEKGLQYMRKIAALKPTMRTGHSLLASLVAAGEFALYPDGYPRRVEVLRARGAHSIDWVWLEPVIADLHPTAITADAPHPTAARTFEDYLLSAEGQDLIGMRFGRLPSRKGIKLKYPRMSIEGKTIHWSSPALMAKYGNRYADLFRSIFVK